MSVTNFLTVFSFILVGVYSSFWLASLVVVFPVLSILFINPGVKELKRVSRGNLEISDKYRNNYTFCHWLTSYVVLLGIFIHYPSSSWVFSEIYLYGLFHGTCVLLGLFLGGFFLDKTSKTAFSDPLSELRILKFSFPSLVVNFIVSAGVGVSVLYLLTGK